MYVSPAASSSSFTNDSLTSAVVEPASLAAPAAPADEPSQVFTGTDSLAGSQGCPAAPADEQSQVFTRMDSLTGSEATPAAPAKDGQSQGFARIYA